MPERKRLCEAGLSGINASETSILINEHLFHSAGLFSRYLTEKVIGSQPSLDVLLFFAFLSPCVVALHLGYQN